VAQARRSLPRLGARNDHQFQWAEGILTRRKLGRIGALAHSNDDLSTAPELSTETGEASGFRHELGFVVIHAQDDEELIGAWISCAETGPPCAGVLGRGVLQAKDAHLRLKAVRQRPHVNVSLPPFSNPSLSREQVLVRPLDRETLELKNVGRLPLFLNEEQSAIARARVGDVVRIGNQLVLLVASRPPTLQPSGHFSLHPFGDADQDGYVGESPKAWQLRSEIAFMGPLSGHVLVTGATGTGKELVATAFHRHSGRRGPLVSRNAATFPESLVDAELFGNLKGYPNPGMPERKGLVGTADHGSLFLDEFAELAPEAQAKLLRVLDSGEYQTLGESRARRSDFRLIAATNRPEAVLRDDLLARFDLRLRTPPLSERREDVPFLARHFLMDMTAEHPHLRDKVFNGRIWPRFTPLFVTNLVRSPFPTNLRGLRVLLWQAVSNSIDGVLDWPSEPDAQQLGHVERSAGDEVRELERVLEEHGGSIEKSWRALGLSSRYALMRLLRKHGVTVSRRAERE